MAREGREVWQLPWQLSGCQSGSGLGAVWQTTVWQLSGCSLADNSLAAVWVQSGRQQSGSGLGAV